MTIFKLLLQYLKKLLTDSDELGQDGMDRQKEHKFDSSKKQKKNPGQDHRGQITIEMTVFELFRR